jgi:hypothetical protein
MVSRELLIGAYGEADATASDAADLAVYVAGLRASGGLCTRDYATVRAP